MYLPPHVEDTRVEELHRFIAEYPLGALVMNGPNGSMPNHTCRSTESRLSG